jgi:hypothetical protein
MLLIAGLAACSHANQDATPSGTNVLDWDTSKTTRPALKTATFDGKQGKDQSMTFEVADADQVKLKVHLETATAKYQEDGSAMQLVVVTAISATVEDGKDYTFSAGSCSGPNYELAAPGQAPGYTILDCQIAATKPHTRASVFFQMKGDGTILPPVPAK